MTLIDLKNLCSQGMYYKKNKDEIEAFDHRAKNELITIKHISELQECSGIPLKFTASDIGWIVHQFWRTDINTDSICSMVKTVNELDIRTGNISSDIVGAVNNKMCVADIKGYATVKDDSGKPLYSLSDMIRLKQEDISSNGLEHLIKLKGKDGKPFLGIDEIKMMQKAQSDILLPFGIGFKLTQDYEEMSKYIAQLIDAFDKSGINYPLDNAKIVRYTQLRLPIKDIIFNDTKKPNALIVYPISDNAAYYNLYNGVKFIRNIISRYDVQLIIAKDKDDVYNAIDYIPNIEFLCLAGHGKRYELNLSEGGYDVSLSKLESRGKIDTSDSEFADHLRRLNPGAVIYLFSCSTGEGGDTALNLANKIAEWSDNRKVISFTGPTAVGFFTSQKTSVTAYDLIKSYYPFDMVKDGRIHSNR